MNWLKAHWKDILIGLLVASTATFAYLWQYEVTHKTELTGTLLKAKESLQAQQDKLAAGDMTREDLQKFYKSLQTYTGQVEGRLASTKKSLDSLGQQYRLLNTQYNSGQTDLKARIGELQQLQTRFDQLAAENTKNVAAANELATKNSALAQQINEVTGNFNNLGQQNQQLTRNYNDLTNTVKEKDNAIRQAQAQAAEANRDAQNAAKQLGELTRRNGQLERQVDELQDRIKALQAGGGGGN